MNAAQKVVIAAQKLAKNKLEVTQEDNTVIVYFRTDVSMVAFLMALGKIGLNCQISRPQQVVKLGKDTVISAKILNGPSLHLQMDVRGFLDAMTLEN